MKDSFCLPKGAAEVSKQGRPACLALGWNSEAGMLPKAGADVVYALLSAAPLRHLNVFCQLPLQFPLQCPLGQAEMPKPVLEPMTRFTC